MFSTELSDINKHFATPSRRINLTQRRKGAKKDVKDKGVLLWVVTLNERQV